MTFGTCEVPGETLQITIAAQVSRTNTRRADRAIISQDVMVLPASLCPRLVVGVLLASARKHAQHLR